MKDAEIRSRCQHVWRLPSLLTFDLLTVQGQGQGQNHEASLAARASRKGIIFTTHFSHLQRSLRLDELDHCHLVLEIWQ